MAYDRDENGDEDSIVHGRYLSGPAGVAIPCALSGLSAVSSALAVSAHRVSFRHLGFFPEILYEPAVCRLSLYSSFDPPKPSRLILLSTILDS
jgi:hypothetical protein